MDILITLLGMLSSITNPSTLMFISVLAALSIVGLALYVAVLALKHRSDS